MGDIHTVGDKLSVVFANVSRKLQDINLRTLGTRTQILRIAVGLPDSWGQSVDDLKDMIISDVIIKHPWANKIQIFQKMDEATSNANTEAIDLWEFLPVEIRIPWKGDYEEKPIELLKGDILVQVLRDEHGTPIPIILQVTRCMGEFAVSNLVGKTWEACLARGAMQDNIQAAINLYIESLA